MQMEKLRAPFSVIACEIKREFNFSDLKFNARIDRIDKTVKDEVIIIDYKTGQVRISDWFTERPDDPQLPLYAIINDEVSCISYAEVKREKIRFTGLSASNEIMPGIKSLADSRYATETATDTGDLSTWDKQLDRWREILMGLVNEFREGHAEVDPKNANSCRYCDLHAFCRIHEKNKHNINTGRNNEQ